MWQQLDHPWIASLKKPADEPTVLVVRLNFFKVDDDNKLWYMSQYGHIIEASRIDLFK